jgi:hypothetical protein
MPKLSRQRKIDRTKSVKLLFAHGVHITLIHPLPGNLFRQSAARNLMRNLFEQFVVPSMGLANLLAKS